MEKTMSDAEFHIEDLSVTEKLCLMERIWIDLEKCPSDIPSPEWHGDVLARRHRAVENGESAFVDWKEAKKRLQHRYE
jgi:hypothetical protein